MGFIFGLFSLAFCLGATLLWVWSVIDIVKGEFKSSTDKIVWLLLVLLVPVLGVILYLILGRNQKTDKLEDFV